jgi:hypothetical protein
MSKFDIGIVVPAYNMPIDIITRFSQFIKSSMKSSSLNYDIYIPSNESDCLTFGTFNRSKATNCGIKYFLDKADVIICTDVDIVPAPGIIDLTYKKSIQTDSLVFAMARYIDFKNKEFDFSPQAIKFYNSFPMAFWARGVWNSMTSKNWYKLGGWNEELYGWGYEDIELHLRSLKKNFDIYSLFCLLIHVNHPNRGLNRQIHSTRNILMARNKNWINHNWLK